MVHVAPNLQLARTWCAFILPLFNLFCVSARDGPPPDGLWHTMAPGAGTDGPLHCPLRGMPWPGRALPPRPPPPARTLRGLGPLPHTWLPGPGSPTVQGNLKPRPDFPAGWVWAYYLSPMSWTQCESSCWVTCSAPCMLPQALLWCGGATLDCLIGGFCAGLGWQQLGGWVVGRSLVNQARRTQRMRAPFAFHNMPFPCLQPCRRLGRDTDGHAS